MRGFVYVLGCVVALASYSQAQLPGAGGPGIFPGGGPTIPPVTPDPTRTEACAKFWVQEGNSCYLFDSGAFSRRVVAGTANVANNPDGLFQADANTYCGRMHPNASLVTVNNLAENNFLYEWAVRMMREPVPVWIGLHAGPMGRWQWYSGEPVNYTNWEMMTAPRAELGLGATIFEADIINQMFNNQVEITPQWVDEHSLNEPHALICEYHPSGMTAAAATNAPTFPPMTTAPPMAATTRGPVMFQNNPRNLVNRLSGGRFGGSLLHEIPRRQRMRPSNYRKNPYFGIQP